MNRKPKSIGRNAIKHVNVKEYAIVHARTRTPDVRRRQGIPQPCLMLIMVFLGQRGLQKIIFPILRRRDLEQLLKALSIDNHIKIIIPGYEPLMSNSTKKSSTIQKVCYIIFFTYSSLGASPRSGEIVSKQSGGFDTDEIAVKIINEIKNNVKPVESEKKQLQ